MLIPWDERRDYIILPSIAEAISFAAEHWIHSAQRAIQQKGRFAVALSGGSTPKAIYERLSQTKSPLDWSKVWLFWSDERGVPPSHPDNNYRMAMEHLGHLPIPPSQIFRMKAESNPEQHALEYETLIHHYLGKPLFDLVMLGVGEDGHTASLFPHAAALAEFKKLVVFNPLPEKRSWRMTLTFPCINQSALSVIYALGPSKKQIVPQVLQAPIDSPFPSSRIGTPSSKALWVLDSEAAQHLK